MREELAQQESVSTCTGVASAQNVHTAGTWTDGDPHESVPHTRRRHSAPRLGLRLMESCTSRTTSAPGKAHGREPAEQPRWMACRTTPSRLRDVTRELPTTRPFHVKQPTNASNSRCTADTTFRWRRSCQQRHSHRCTPRQPHRPHRTPTFHVKHAVSIGIRTAYPVTRRRFPTLTDTSGLPREYSPHDNGKAPQNRQVEPGI